MGFHGSTLKLGWRSVQSWVKSGTDLRRRWATITGGWTAQSRLTDQSPNELLLVDCLKFSHSCRSVLFGSCQSTLFCNLYTVQWWINIRYGSLNTYWVSWSRDKNGIRDCRSYHQIKMICTVWSYRGGRRWVTVNFGGHRGFDQLAHPF